METATPQPIDPKEEAVGRALWLQGFLTGLVPINHPARRVVADSIALLIAFIQSSHFDQELFDANQAARQSNQDSR